jgi:HEPN domain-containing protein
MTKTDVQKLIEYWKKGAELDYNSAVAISVKAKQYVQACFFIHLSLEKILKTYIVFHTKEHAPYIHSLPLLAKKTDLTFTKTQLEFLVEVNDFNLRCRYPDDSFSIYKKATAKKTQNLLKQTEEFKLWILEKLNK